MPFPIVNSIISWFLKKRIHQIELFLKYPTDVQDEVLAKLLQTAKRTEFGKQYDFSSIRTYQDFASNVILSNFCIIQTCTTKMDDCLY